MRLVLAVGVSKCGNNIHNPSYYSIWLRKKKIVMDERVKPTASIFIFNLRFLKLKIAIPLQVIIAE